MVRRLFYFLATLLLVGSQGSEEHEDPYHQLPHEELHSYSFERYLMDFDKTYSNPQEFAQREAVFHANVNAIQQHNREHARELGYTLGINQFTDILPHDVPMGYVKTYHSNHAATSRRLLGNGAKSLESVITTVPVEKLPEHVDWRQKGITTPIKNQYYCGSCWAFASTAVIESHVARATGILFSLSEQELVSCATNPLHCGGSGGCEGATAEIAMEYVRTHGMVDEWTFGYASNHGAKVQCTLEEGTASGLRGRQDDDDKHYLRHAVASIDGWMTLPSNNYTAVMNAVAQIGPLAITVACSPWVMYKKGIYSGNLKSRKETDINHMVVLEGYGTDPETGKDYWLVRNSWGPRWGEAGYIRLARVDPATMENPEDDCGVDVTPADGVDCTIDENGDPVAPPDERICGNSGILYDVTIPLSAHLL